MKIAVLLVSDQTLPNVLFIKQFGPFDACIFLTTKRMEEKGCSNWILNATGIQGVPVEKLLIDPENANVAYTDLKSFPWAEGSEFMVHVTGGTKMMALATFSFFQDIEQARILYLPINAPHFIEIIPDQRSIPLTIRVTLEQYLKAYGVVIQERNNYWRSLVSEAQDVMDVVQHKKKGPKVQRIRQLITTASNGQNDLSPENRKFYSGEWFEIWLASRISKLYNLDDSAIWVNAKLNIDKVKSNTSYEYDVVFIYNNILYTGECKYYNKGRVGYNKLRENLFKYASVVVQYGLNARPFFAIANQIIDKKEKEQISDRCKILRLPFPADMSVLQEDSSIQNYISKI